MLPSDPYYYMSEVFGPVKLEITPFDAFERGPSPLADWEMRQLVDEMGRRAMRGERAGLADVWWMVRGERHMMTHLISTATICAELHRALDEGRLSGYLGWNLGQVHSIAPVPSAIAPAPAKKEDAKPERRPKEDIFTKARPKEQLVKVEFMEGDQSVAGDVKQFVNLPQSSKWVDGQHVKHLDRLGQALKFRVSFNKSGSFGFKAKLEPHPNNAVYSDSEKGRNPNFNFTEQERSYTTDGDGTKIIEGDLRVSCAGNDRFRIVARDNHGNEVRSGWARNKRLGYYVPIVMDDLPGKPVGIEPALMEYERQALEWLPLPKTSIRHMKAIDINNSASDNQLLGYMKAAWDGSQGRAREPFAVALAFVDQVLWHGESVAVRLYATAGPGQPAVIPILDRKKNPGRIIYCGLDSTDWYISGEFRYDDGRVELIPRESCTLNIPRESEGDFTCISVRVRVDSLPAGKGRVVLRVITVEGWAGGISYNQFNVVCIALRSRWQKSDLARQHGVVVHELGHQCRMVPEHKPTDAAAVPDGPSTYYDGNGHWGGHCHKGLALVDQFTDEKGECVMFGSTNSVLEFCDGCSKCIKKVDLSRGWSGGNKG